MLPVALDISIYSVNIKSGLHLETGEMSHLIKGPMGPDHHPGLVGVYSNKVLGLRDAWMLHSSGQSQSMNMNTHKFKKNQQEEGYIHLYTAYLVNAVRINSLSIVLSLRSLP